MQVLLLLGKPDSTLRDLVLRCRGMKTFAENNPIALRRWKEIRAIGNATSSVSLLLASSVSLLMRKVDVGNLGPLFSKIRRETNPPAVRHHLGAQAIRPRLPRG